MNTEPVKDEITEGSPEKGSPLPMAVFDTLEMFCWAFFAVVVLFSLFFRFCRVEGSSMMNTLSEGQTLLVSDLGYTPKTGDIVVFQNTGEALEEPFLIKRVIATEGQHLLIDFAKKEVYIDGVLYDDPHAHFLNRLGQEIDRYQSRADVFYDPYTGLLELTVPEDKIFVMGDNRNNSLDSRDSRVGLVEEDHVIGKAVLRLLPFTLFTH